jgi:hypothetical protein
MKHHPFTEQTARAVANGGALSACKQARLPRILVLALYGAIAYGLASIAALALTGGTTP